MLTQFLSSIKSLPSPPPELKKEGQISGGWIPSSEAPQGQEWKLGQLDKCNLSPSTLSKDPPSLQVVLETGMSSRLG